jgi:sugar phosphate isomerase/epimerase
MRISVSPFSSVNNSFDDDLSMWAQLGVSAVGISSAKTASFSHRAVASRLSELGFSAAYVVHPVGPSVDDDAGWATETDQMFACVDLASELGAATIYSSMGSQGDLRWGEACDLLGRRLEPVLDRARGAGVTLSIETVHSSRPELGFARAAHDAFEVAKRIGIQICLDLYVSWADRDLETLVKDHLDMIGLVQISDFRRGDRLQPKRRVPGDGDLPLRRVLNDVFDAGYTGYVDLELLGPDIEDEGYASAIGRGLEWMRKFDESGAATASGGS